MWFCISVILAPSVRVVAGRGKASHAGVSFLSTLRTIMGSAETPKVLALKGPAPLAWYWLGSTIARSDTSTGPIGMEQRQRDS